MLRNGGLARCVQQDTNVEQMADPYDASFHRKAFGTSLESNLTPLVILLPCPFLFAASPTFALVNDFKPYSTELAQNHPRSLIWHTDTYQYYPPLFLFSSLLSNCPNTGRLHGKKSSYKFCSRQEPSPALATAMRIIRNNIQRKAYDWNNMLQLIWAWVGGFVELR